MKNYKFYVFAVLIFFSITVWVGCMDKKEFKIFTQKSGIAHFSFEYKTYYQMQKTQTMDYYSFVGLDGPYHRDIVSYTHITIEVWKPNERNLDALSLYNRDFTADKMDNDFQLIEQFKTTIDGVVATGFSFQSRNTRAQIFGSTDNKLYDVYQRVYLDNKGLIWRFDLMGDSSTAESDKADFEQLLSTFKFLS
jgi:hypothetical protein